MYPNKAEIYALWVILSMAGTAAVVARVCVRLQQKAKLQLDDWTACGGCIVMWPVTGIIIAGTANNRFGSHTIQDPETRRSHITDIDRENLKYRWIVIIIGILSIGLIKLSVVLLYRRLFTTIAFLAANIFQCGTYPAAAWTSGKLLLQHCNDISAATTARGFTNVIMDLTIVASPLPIVWQMGLTMPQKLQVTCIFALGFLAVAAGSIRAYIMLRDPTGHGSGTKMGYRDLQGQNTTMVLWTLVEIALALIGCCLPTLRPLLSNTLLGTVFGNLISAVSFRFRRSQSTRQDKLDGNLAIVSIGGTKWKDPDMSAKEKNPQSLTLSDVGNLA
ncbi:hypothetical protein GQ44DRAFT_746004 [Phaeosphaeriaceae sp. PMI808]|nr:hypothetical protein GQ44DRAFT_746004 [Phaeosphaeriaceae sp. PMI808]